MITKIRNFLTLEHIAMIIISIILLQTLPFKFLGLPESVALFTKLWQEPRGRIGTGILELFGVIGIRILHTKKYAAGWIAILMMGALYFHTIVLGWDGLALSAGIIVLCSLFIVIKK